MKCFHCPCPIDSIDNFPLPRAQGRVVCKCCYVLWFVIHANAHFIAAQTEWEMEMKKLGRLRFGADYFLEIEGEEDGS